MQDHLNLLWSINDRLGALPGAEERGADFEPPTLDWLNDVCRADAEMARQLNEADARRQAELAAARRQQKQKPKGRRR